MTAFHNHKRWVAGTLLAVFGLTGTVGLSSCDANGNSRPIVFDTGGPATPLTGLEVGTIIIRAVSSIDADDLHVAVTDRTGDILGAYSTTAANPADIQDRTSMRLTANGVPNLT